MSVKEPEPDLRSPNSLVRDVPLTAIAHGKGHTLRPKQVPSLGDLPYDNVPIIRLRQQGQYRTKIRFDPYHQLVS